MPEIHPECEFASYVRRRYRPDIDAVVEAVWCHLNDDKAIVRELKDAGVIAESTYWKDVVFFKGLKEYFKSSNPF